MARRRTHTSEDFVQAALRIVDAEGLEALSFRRLGEQMGISFTSVYTYFKSRQALVETVAGHVVAEAFESLDLARATPRERITAMALAARRGMTKHPRAVPAFLVSTTNMPGTIVNMAAVMGALEEAGLSGARAGIAYRVIESYSFGATIFDLGAAPEHLEIRRRRYAEFKHPAFAGLERSKKAVGEHNDAAFLTGLGIILDAFGV